jgi:hypothetical protein
MADNDELEVLLTTYDMAWKPDDNKFLRRKIQFDVSCCGLFGCVDIDVVFSAVSLTRDIPSRISRVNVTRV